MDVDQSNDGDRVSLMTLHAAKGLEFDTVFLTGWEEGLFPHQRALDEQGQAGLEEERRLAYVGITRARKQAHISFAQNRRLRGLFQAATPSRFVDELPEAHVEVREAKSPFGGAYANPASLYGNPYGRSRFDDAQTNFRSSYSTPGWQRAQNARPSQAPAKAPVTIEGQLVASSTAEGAGYRTGDRVFHQKFGEGRVAEVDGNKLTIEFKTAGRKRLVDSFVRPL
jgi:DNA helicase-2/ATP-dependent DNA helicase PcrA